LDEGEALVTRVVIDCRQVRREISNYLDDQIDPHLRERMEAHFADCKHCHAILDGTRNIIQLVADDRVFETPAGFGMRLLDRLKNV
jgi:anti-sigma factor RsiW